MPDLTSTLGFLAASLTSLSYLPQVRKALPRNSTDDLSLKMLLTLFAGLSLWITYGAMIGDVIIVTANAVGASLVGIVLACKLRDRSGQTRVNPERAHPDQVSDEPG